MNDHFYITLPSNSSMHIFPDNTLTHFKTHLSKRISLPGEWEVGLVEIHYPRSFFTLPSDECYIKVEHMNGDVIQNLRVIGWKVLKFKAGKIESIEELIKTMNSTNDIPNYAKIWVHDSRIRIEAKPGVIKLVLSDSLRRIFNLPTNEIKFGPQGAAEDPKKIIDIYACLPTQMYVYCDVVEPQPVGDVVAPLLRIVNVENGERHNDERQVVSIFTHPHYTPVLKREFQQIEIDIRNDLGKNISFFRGHLNVKLHFRKIR